MGRAVATATADKIVTGIIEFRKKNAKLHMQNSLVFSMIRAYLPLHYLCEAQYEHKLVD